jgi:hypothetical protein
MEYFVVKELVIKIKEVEKYTEVDLADYSELDMPYMTRMLLRAGADPNLPMHHVELRSFRSLTLYSLCDLDGHPFSKTPFAVPSFGLYSASHPHMMCGHSFLAYSEYSLWPTRIIGNSRLSLKEQSRFS